MARTGSHVVSLYGRDGRRKYVTPSERARLIRTASSDSDALRGTLCLVLALTGCRISEALALTVSSIECSENFIAIRSLKKRGLLVVREIPIPPSLIRRLRRCCHLGNRAADERLFPWSRGWGWLQVKQVLIASGCTEGPHLTAKGLRHGFGIHAIRSGVPLTLVRKWLGHASLETTAIYLDVVGVEEREFAERMWGT